MKPEYYCILFLTLIIVILFFLLKSKKKQFEQKLSQHKGQYEQQLSTQKDQYEQQLSTQKKQYEQQLREQEAEAAEYKNQVIANFNEPIPHGERLLIKSFKALFDSQEFKEFVIYHHLEFYTENGFKQIDFFVVSPKGLFVIESKRWKGVTYIYHKTTCNMFQNEIYRSYGLGSNKDVRVFNTQQNIGNTGEIQLSAYQNPIAQARDYSKCLLKILNVRLIKNVVIFNTADDYKVLYDNKPLNMDDIDDYTSVITDAALKAFFERMPSKNSINTQRIIELIESKDSKFWYRFKLDSRNYQQAPFESI